MPQKSMCGNKYVSIVVMSANIQLTWEGTIVKIGKDSKTEIVVQARL